MRLVYVDDVKLIRIHRFLKLKLREYADKQFGIKANAEKNKNGRR